MTGVHRIAAGDAARDLLLYAVLGVPTWLARLDALLVRHVPPDDDGAATAEPVSNEVAVVLGVLAVRARILRELDAIAVPVECEPAAPTPRPGWLR